MTTPQNEVQEGTPALVVLFGNAEKKAFPLTLAAVTVGRARGCDIELNAPQISSIHCVITRTHNSLHLRDCESRVGCRVNGENTREAFLTNGDILQIGPFSFEVYVPWKMMPQDMIGSSQAWRRLQRLEHSRRRLAEIALRMRRRSRGKTEDKPLTRTQTIDIRTQFEILKQKVRDYEQSGGDFEKLKVTLNEDRELLRKEQEALQECVQSFERETAERRSRVELEIQRRWQECDQRCKDAERALTEKLLEAERAAAARLTPEHAQHIEAKERDLELRELELSERSVRVEKAELELKSVRLELQRAQHDMVAKQDEYAVSTKEAAAIVSELEARRADVARLLDDLNSLYLNAHARQNDELEALFRLHARFQQMQNAQASPFIPDVQKEEIDIMRRRFGWHSCDPSGDTRTDVAPPPVPAAPAGKDCQQPVG